MRQVRQRLVQRVAAPQKADHQPPKPPLGHDFEQRLAAARAAVAPQEPVAYRFHARQGGFAIEAITVDDLTVAIPGTTLGWPKV